MIIFQQSLFHPVTGLPPEEGGDRDAPARDRRQVQEPPRGRRGRLRLVAQRQAARAHRHDQVSVFILSSIEGSGSDGIINDILT